MPVELNKFTLAGIGLVTKAQQVIEDYIKGRSQKDEEEEVAEKEEAEKTEKSLREQFDDLVDLGEEKYDEFTEKLKERRERVSEKARERLSDLFSELGLVTREDLEVLEGKIERLRKMAKKLSA